MSEPILDCPELKLEDSDEGSDTKCDLKEVCKSKVQVKCEEEDEGKSVGQRENRLTSIIDQLRCQSQLKGSSQPAIGLASTSNGKTDRDRISANAFRCDARLRNWSNK
ncbi:PREDICTED: uncharacterized protein LOC106108499 [Papilio polytes]|uniref:uncharacterized protein LOC106108499 n=1 Tax=Papilio polytes TaxID=76194 RepID=UPI000675BC87|nr:PREDICTED: uncharacterized protein LOC106108499 [Papilio polytes]